MCCRISLSKHLMTADIKAIGRLSMRQLGADDFDTGIKLFAFRYGGDGGL